MQSRRGFTIVELLVVIVVIAILAAITVVAYNGIQNRARLSASYSVIRSYQTTFRLIASETTLPAGNACLGPSSAYPSGCSIGGQNAVTNTTANNLLTSYGMGTQPVLPLSDSYKPIVFSTSFYGANGVILYNLPGGYTDCGAGPVMSPNGSGVWGFYGAKSSLSDGSNSTFCAVGITN